jgi:hypothetical protein
MHEERFSGEGKLHINRPTYYLRHREFLIRLLGAILLRHAGLSLFQAPASKLLVAVVELVPRQSQAASI